MVPDFSIDSAQAARRFAGRHVNRLEEGIGNPYDAPGQST
jgi:hypothetical protein